MAPFPLSGPNEGSVRFEVVDNYKFAVSYNDADPMEPSLVFLFDTPGSAEPRKMELKLETKFKEAHIMAGFEFDSILAKLRGAAGFVNDDQAVKLYGHFDLDKEQHKLELGFAKSGNQQRQEYTPIVNLNVDYKVEGSIVVEKQGAKTSYTFNNVRLVAPNDSPFSLNGNMVRESSKLDCDLTFAKDSKKGNIKGQLEVAPSKLLVDVEALSNFHEMANGRVVFVYNREPTKTGSSVSRGKYVGRLRCPGTPKAKGFPKGKKSPKLLKMTKIYVMKSFKREGCQDSDHVFEHGAYEFFSPLEPFSEEFYIR